MSPPVKEQVEQFRREGFVVVRDLLSPAELERYGRAVDRAVAERTAGDTRPLSDKSRYEQSFLQCINLWEDFAEVKPLSFHPRIAGVAAELLGVQALRLWHDQALYKEPHGRETDPHHDQPYWPIEQMDTITAWIPLEGSTLESGAMGYVPGSHHFGLHGFPNIFSGRGFDLERGPEARGRTPVFVEVPPGGVAYHHGLTIHLARPNATERMRRVHTAIYFADGCTRALREQRHPAVDRAGIEPGAPIASEVTPLAWPRPRGDLPLAPPCPDPPIRGWPGWTRRARAT